MLRLTEKVVLITGGESGIGLATARLFAAEGARLHLVGLDQDRLADAARELDALASVVDVTDEEAVRRAVGEGVERYGRYDVLFSNAGISGDIVAIVDYPSDMFTRVLAVHVLGTFHVLKHGAPQLRDGGSIVITSSAVGLVGAERLSAYVAAKHAQVGLMRAAAKELARRAIRVNTIHPGPTETALQAGIELQATGREPEEAARIFDRMVPFGRHTTPDEIAHAVLYLASDESAMVTSHTLSIDGGMTG
jgi:NAD(P)-dependent dehydrogenase (short-subunit alcohol dehydrogenase family)